MATKANIVSITLVAAADLTAQQFRVVKVNASGQAALANATDLNAIGILQDKTPAGAAATVAVAGSSKARAGGTIAAGAAVTSDANGNVVAAATGRQIIGHALTGGVSGDLITVLLGSRGIF